VQLRGATLDRAEMPFPLTGVSLRGNLDPSGLAIEMAEGRNGKTFVKLRGSIGGAEAGAGPMDLLVEVTDLELDERLKRATPPDLATLWDEYRPTGWIDLGLRLVRPRADAPIGFGLTVRCQDVGVVFHMFPYPVSNVRGTIVWQGTRMELDLRTRVGGDWVTCRGTVENPGPDAVVKLDFAGSALPMDEELLRALPPEQREVVAAFRPAGTVRGVIHVARTPPAPPARPAELVDIHAELDLNEGCSVRWEGLPYPIQDLTGHLDLKPDRWEFRAMKGRNGAATIEANGVVVQTAPDVQAATINLVADHLPFDQQLREALPPEWQATWATLNPSGFSRVEARITGRTDEEPHYHLKVVPEPAATRVKLVLTDVASAPGAAPAPKVIELPPMEKVAGTFLYDDGAIRMSGVSCEFREAPVSFRQGTLNLDGTGAFRLAITDLMVTKLRLDAELRKIMPPVMAQFAQRLDDGRPFWMRGDLGIGWSGRAGEPARCEWRDVTVVFTGNTIQTGVPIEQLQGQIDHIHGWSDGRSIEVGGAVNLASVRLGGQQLTDLSTPLNVANGQASLGDIKGTLLGGTVYGSMSLSLDTTPHYKADLQLIGADLARYTMTLPGRQTLKGLVNARLTVEGQGNDLRTCVGEGWARVQNGDLGQLPIALRWIKTTSFRPPTRTAFDSAELHATLGDGRATFDRITLTGDALSLDGAGTLELQGSRELDLRLSPRYGRDERRVPVLGEVVREASSRVVDVHITGPSNAPTVRPEPLPGVWTRAGEALRRAGERRETRRTNEANPR
jgi:hypothetical protein